MGECKTAAETLGFGIGGTESTGSYPKGCYVYTYDSGDEKVWYNEHSTGLTNDLSPNLDKSMPICIITGSEACKTAEVGSSTENSKTIDFDDSFKCPAIVNKYNWENDEEYGDTFDVEQADGILTVTRSDKENSWGMPLKFKCCTCY